MDSKIFFVLGIFLLASEKLAEAKRYKMVAYWGQNGVYAKHKERERWEKELDHFCNTFRYDVIVLAFNHIFFDSRNKDSMPGMNFAFHCETPVSKEYPSLLRCPRIEADILKCQKKGIQVLLSMGGAAGRYGFSNDAQAKKYAHTIWDLFLGGDKLQHLRPFGQAILDGVDLDIEGGGFTGYTAFTREIRGLMDADSRKNYLIAAAPQCPFPDGHLGPYPGKALGDTGNLFDEVYVQFYNNWCHTGNPRVFWENVPKWLNFAKKAGRPKIMVGLPAAIGASGNAANFRPIKELQDIFNRLKDDPQFGGFMIWDAGFDQNNIISNQVYSDYIVDIMNGNSVVPPPTGKPVTLPPNTGKPPTDAPKPGTTAPPTGSPTGPSSVSCAGLGDGYYAYPGNCSKFFICHGGIPYVRSCPTGLLWHKSKKLCDWPQNVQC